MNDGSPVHPYGIALIAFAIVVATFALEHAQVREGNFAVVGRTVLIFLPTFIAGGRLHRNTNAIFVCNLIMFNVMLVAISNLLPFVLAEVGLVVGWVITMVWSFTASWEQRKIFAPHFSHSESTLGAGSHECDYSNQLNDSTGGTGIRDSKTENDQRTPIPPICW